MACVRDIDGTGAFWKKTREVAVQRDLYLEAIKNKNYDSLRPKPHLTWKHYEKTHAMWEQAIPPSRTALGVRGGFNKCRLAPGSLPTIRQYGYGQSVVPGGSAGVRDAGVWAVGTIERACIHFCFLSSCTAASATSLHN